MWTCPACAFTLPIDPVFPVNCKCGAVDKGPEIPWTPPPCRWVTTADRVAATVKLMQRLPANTAAIAGIPRSGMLPAAFIAERLHLPLYEATPAGIRPMHHGERYRDNDAPGPMVVIDDTIASGYSLSKIIPTLGPTHLLAVLFASPQCATRVHLFAELLPMPHYLEWNLFNSIYTADIGTDIDGILCPDPDPPYDDCKYEKFLQNAPILQRPVRDVIPLIATGRRRRYRQHTEAWLAQRGIRYERLVFPTTDEEHDNPGLMKARAYAESRATIFVESDEQQAKLIADITGKRVICPCVSQVWN